jgi:hypothetical protein
MVEIDNNRAENAMRPIALGSKNWMQIGSEKAGPKIAPILSVLETSKRLGVNEREYLQEVLPQLSYRAIRPEVQGLMPPGGADPCGVAAGACESGRDPRVVEGRPGQRVARGKWGNRENRGTGETAHASRVPRLSACGQV